jgi:hypothetical protein
MKDFLIVCFLLVLILGGTWVWHAHHDAVTPVSEGGSFTGLGDNESYAHKLARYRAGADEALISECTNVVIGLRTIIQHNTETYDHNFTKWTGSATVEFINMVGGVERTNLEFIFDPNIDRKPRWFQK